MTHRVFSLLSIDFQLQHFFVDVVVTSRSNVSDSSLGTRRNQNAMFREETVLVDCTEDVTLTENVSHLEGGRLELPEFFWVQTWNINTFGNEDGLRKISNNLQRTLNTVENFS